MSPLERKLFMGLTVHMCVHAGYVCREEVEEQVKGERKNAKKKQKKTLIPTGAVMKIHTEATCPSSPKLIV